MTDLMPPAASKAFANLVLNYFQDGLKASGLDMSLDEWVRLYLIGSCIFIGEVEGRHVCASDIEIMTGIPRSTVQRTIQRLVDQGIISATKLGRRTVYTHLPYEGHEALTEQQQAVRTKFVRAIRDLLPHD